MSSSVRLGEKPESYYGQERSDLVERLEPPLGRVLDVGCGRGGVGGPLRRAGATRIVGIELHDPSAEEARKVYDEVHAGSAEELVEAIDETFETIVCYDALEHFVDPATFLRRLHRLAAPGARLHLSVPNARHWTLIRDLVLRGTFGYGDWGHRDSTHLRWFTRRDLVELLEETGWRVADVSHGQLRSSSRALARVTRGLSVEFLVYQWLVLATEQPARARAGAPAGGP